MPRRAATTRLEPGTHSIDRATPRQRGEVWRLDWSVRLPDGRLIEKRSQSPTKGEVRRRAKVTAAELLTSGAGGTWKSTAPMVEYLAQVARPAIEKARLRANSQARYSIVLHLLAGRCEKHKHTDSLKGHSIASATRFRVLERCLQEIAALHGSETARQARNVLSKYVLHQLVRDELIAGNPLSGMSIDLSPSRGTTRSRGGQALTRGQYAAVVDHLLQIDPAEGITAPSRGRWTREDLVAKRANTIDITLLQAVTGLRVGEANALTWHEVEVDDQGGMHVFVREETSKTHKARRVPVLDSRVAERLLQRQNAARSQDHHVIGSPADASTEWERGNCRKAVAALYVELAEDLDIDLLRTARSHVWRATLNTLLLDAVPEVVRAAFFGHDAAVNRSAYTDLTDTAGMVAAARTLRAV